MNLVYDRRTSLLRFSATLPAFPMRGPEETSEGTSIDEA